MSEPAEPCERRPRHHHPDALRGHPRVAGTGLLRACRQWRFPASLLGLLEQGTQSPAVQEIAALTVSQLPAPEAQQVVERLTGRKLCAATLARAAQVQGQRAQAQRQHLWAVARTLHPDDDAAAHAWIDAPGQA